MPVKVPWIKLPKTNLEQLKNGTKGVIFKLSPQYVGKILYGIDGEDYWLKDGNETIKELEYEENINRLLYEEKIGNVPKPIGIENLGLFNGAYPVYIMEYIQGLPHGDEIVTSFDQYQAENLVRKEVFRAADIDIYPSKKNHDYLNPRNYFFDKSNEKVRLIDFGRWVTGDTIDSPYA